MLLNQYHFDKMTDENDYVRNALSQVGIKVNNIYDLVNTNQDYTEAIPVLVDLLKKGIKDDKVKEGIIRSLAVKHAKGKAGDVLLKEFNKIPVEKTMLRWAIGNTMSIIITNDDLEGVLEIIKDKKNGVARQMFILSLSKIKSDIIEEILIDLLKDDEVSAYSLVVLGKLKVTRARHQISQLLNHPKSLIKNEAKKALKRIK